MWERIMSLFYRRGRCQIEDQAVKALFAENLQAHGRAGRAAEDVTRASDNSRERLQHARAEIAERTAAESRMRPDPRTSDIRRLAEAALARVQPRPDQKG